VELQPELDVIILVVRDSAVEVSSWRMQIANVLTLAVRVAIAAPETQQARGQKVPDSTDLSWADRTRLTGWLAQWEMVV